MSAQRWSDGEVAKLIPRLETLMEVDPTNVPRDNYLDALMDLRDARAEAARLRAVLIEAQECIDYGTRAGGAAEVLAHIATVLKGDGHATVTRRKAMADVTLAELRALGDKSPDDVSLNETLTVLHAAAGMEELPVSRRKVIELTESLLAMRAAYRSLLDRVPPSDESWQARRAELVTEVYLAVGKREVVAAALDRAFEFGRGLR